MSWKYFLKTNCYWPVAGAAVAVTGPKNCRNRVPRTRLDTPRCRTGSRVPGCPKTGTSMTARHPRTPTSGRKWTAWSLWCWTDIYTHKTYTCQKYRHRTDEFVNMAKHISTYKVGGTSASDDSLNALQLCMSVPHSSTHFYWLLQPKL